MDQAMIEKWQLAAIDGNKQADDGNVQAMWMQNVMLAEIAIQLAKQNEQLARIATAVEMLERS